jgi:hypothetical protein
MIALRRCRPATRYRQVTKSYGFQEISINLEIKLANAPLSVVLKPGAELRGIGARMIGAGPATTSSAADAVPARPAPDFGVPVDPPERGGRDPFAVPIGVAVAGVRSAIEAPTKLVDSSRL